MGDSREYFATLGLGPLLLDAIRACGYAEPTSIQREGVPPAISGRDVLGCAPTGTGKTAAFLWPMLARFEQENAASTPDGSPLALVLSPTRELAVQTWEAIERYRGALDLRAVLCAGGLPAQKQAHEFSRGCEIVVATPGRLVEHVLNGHVNLANVRYTVLDEADRLLDMGFYTDVRRVLRAVKPGGQTLMFSATLDKRIESWAADVLREPVRVEASPSGTMPASISERHVRVNPRAKPHLLLHVLKQSTPGKWLIFTLTRARAAQLADFLAANGQQAIAIHGEMPQRERLAALERFKSGGVRVLVATDVAARGLDISAVTNVVSYELSREPVEYVHRAGRTARMGVEGEMLSLVSDEETALLRDIVAFTGHEIPALAADRGVLAGFDFNKSWPKLPGTPGKGTFKRRAKAKSRLSGISPAKKRGQIGQHVRESEKLRKKMSRSGKRHSSK